MKYFLHMRKVLVCRAPNGMQDRLCIWYCGLNVLVAGLLYAATALALGDQVTRGGAFNPWMILAAGIATAYFVHAGAALMVWVFCKGIGGTQQFFPIYLNMGIAFVALWPLAPALAGLQVISMPLLSAFAVAAAAYAIAVMVTSIAAAVDLSKFRLALAMCATVIYLGCFIYLWT